MPRGKARPEVSAGGVVFRLRDDAPRFLLIHDSHRNWGFPKGHLVEDEEPLAAAVREIAEETGLTDLVLHGDLGTIDWYFRFRGRLIHKYCHFFLFESVTESPVPQCEEGITCCTWHDLGDALVRLSYENARGLLRLAGSMVDRLPDQGRAAPGGRA